MLDRSNMLAVFAFQNGLLSKDQLLAFFGARRQVSSTPIDLSEVLDRKAVEALTPVVDQFLARVGDISDQNAIASLPLAKSLQAEILDALQSSPESQPSKLAPQNLVTPSAGKDSLSTPSAQILTGMVAFQNNFISRQQLIDAFTEWVANPEIALFELLIRQGAIGPDERELIEQMVAAHLKRSGDASQSMALFSSVAAIQQELSQIASQSKSTLLDADMFSKTSDFNFTKGTMPSGSREAPGIDRFRIVKEHARGGLGVVFVAEDRQLRREVALKQIREERADSEPFRQKFKLEAEITGQLEHPGIVPIYALGADDRGRPFYAMRFIQGESLKDGISTFHKRLTDHSTRFDSPELRQLLRRFIDVCNAMDYAHDRGILHRDLKPGNIMLGRHGETLVVDWGLAKTLDSEQDSSGIDLSTAGQQGQRATVATGSATRYGSFVGTAAYAPPEQLRGELDKLSPASDVFCLGGILFEILTGKPPIEHKSSIDEILKQIDTREQNSIRSIRPDIPNPLAFICMKALQSQIADRFATVGELRDKVQCWLDDQAVPGMPEPISIKAMRWVRNHQTLAASALVGLISALVLMSLFYVLTNMHNQELQTANTEINKLNGELSEKNAELSEKNTELSSKNAELLLAGAQTARSRGQFREAAARMQELQQQGELSEEQKLSLAGDLAKAEKQRSSLALVLKIDRLKLTPASAAKLDLLQGDLQLNTSDAKKGFALIQGAISSGLLTPADAAYAKSLVADLASDCQSHLCECLRIEPFNINAITNLAYTCAVLGEVNEAKSQLTFGLSLFPDDIRLALLSALIPAIIRDNEAFDVAIAKLRAMQGLDGEIRAIQIIAKVSETIESVVVNNTTPNFVELAASLTELTILRNSRFDNELIFGLPNLAWAGNLWKLFPSPSEFLTAKPEDVYGRLYLKMRKQIPNHQHVNYLAGAYDLLGDKFDLAAASFLHSASCDMISSELTSRATWIAFISLVQHSINSQKPIELDDYIKLRSLIRQAFERDGEYQTTPFDPVVAWTMLIRSSMHEEAKQLAEQAFRSSDSTVQAEWQSRIDRTAKMEQKVGAAINDLLLPKSE